jgi:hypothetical protein
MNFGVKKWLLEKNSPKKILVFVYHNLINPMNMGAITF